MRDLTQGSILKNIIYFTIPLLIGNFFQLLYNTIDTLIVGQILGEKALAAVGSTGSINFLILGFAIGMTNGLAIITSQKFGAKDEEGVKRSFSTGIFFTASLSLILTALALPFARTILELMQTPSEIIEDARTFLSVLLSGVLVTSLYNYLSNALRALGDSKTPLYALMVASFLNIILDYIFILNFGLGVAGPALATVFSQFLSVLYLIFYIKKKVPQLALVRFDFFKEVKEHVRLAIPMGFQSSIISLGTITLQIGLNMLGTTAVATQAIVGRIDQFAMFPMMSLGLAMATFSAQNFGAKNYRRINKGLLQSLFLGVAWSLVFALTINVFSKQVTGFFISDVSEEVINLASRYYLVNGLFYWILSILFITRSILQGLGNAVIPTICGFMELIMRIVIVLIGISMMEYTVIISGNPGAWIGAVAILVPATLKMYRRFSKAENGEEISLK